MSWKAKEEKANIARKRALDVLKAHDSLHLVDENSQNFISKRKKISKLPDKPSFEVLEMLTQTKSTTPATIKAKDTDGVVNIKKYYHKNWTQKINLFRHNCSGVVVSEYFFQALLRSKKIIGDKTFDLTETESLQTKDGWKVIKDESSQEIYYWNIHTNKTQWTAPV